MHASSTTGRRGVVLAVCALFASMVGSTPFAQPAAKSAPTKACRLQLIGELKVDFSDNRPKVTGAINGQPVAILIDTGAQISLISRPAAQRLKLKLTDLWHMAIVGVDGQVKAQSAYVDVLTVAGASRKGVPLLVAGSLGPGEDMLLGQDFLTLVDEEFDLAHGVLRLLKPTNCADDDMPYWATSYSQAPFSSEGSGDDHMVLHVRLNGAPIDALLDSGAQVSIATLGAAARAGVSIASSAAAHIGSGLAGGGFVERVAELSSFSVGDETINHTSLMFGDFHHGAREVQNGSRLSAPIRDFQEMLLGADFLRSHRVIVSQTHHKIYFTYNGGPVFGLRPPAAASVAGS